MGPTRALPTFLSGSWLIVARVGREVVGYAWVEPTPVPFPPDRPGAGLAVDLENERLAGGTELVELVVHPVARGYGVGSPLEATARSATRDGWAWLVLSDTERAALPFFLRRGWTPGTGGPPDGNRPVVLLSPAHPAGDDRDAPPKDVKRLCRGCGG